MQKESVSEGIDEATGVEIFIDIHKIIISKYIYNYKQNDTCVYAYIYIYTYKYTKFYIYIYMCLYVST